MRIREILTACINGKRITRDEGLQLSLEADILELGEAAYEVRFQKNQQPFVTYVVDTNPNYSNICTIECSFCAFYKRKGETGAFTLSVEELITSFKHAAERGVTTVLLQGGVHPDLPFEYYLELIERTRKEVPHIVPHFFSPPEILGIAQTSGLSVEEVLQKFWYAGLRTLPGGGAEILSDRVRLKISSKKGSSNDWLMVMRIAHRIGYRTTATMMFGHFEEWEDIINHLEAIRILQDETNGFMAFIPWSFKPSNTPLEKVIPYHATPLKYLRILALARLYLDNVPHIQTSWFSEGKKIGQIGLYFGADDFGGTIFEENVHAAAQYYNKATVDECRRLIREAGFIPAQRNTLYNILSIDK
ncbi:MAG: dehypoxanthine futalosine cyclase [Bacteroidetes bacterium]|nr:dehypoxanthine futalosine cyclase [Bacteroidota bacterium]